MPIFSPGAGAAHPAAPVQVWNAYVPQVQETLTRCYNAGHQSATILINSKRNSKRNEYTIDFEFMTQTNAKTGNIRQLRFKTPQKLPLSPPRGHHTGRATNTHATLDAHTNAHTPTQLSAGEGHGTASTHLSVGEGHGATSTHSAAHLGMASTPHVSYDFASLGMSRKKRRKAKEKSELFE